MTRARLWSLAALAIAMLGSLAYTGGHALYLRSSAYRNSCALRLSAYLNLPAEIAAVLPRSRRSLEFHGVRVWLPGRRDQIAFCDSALLVYTPTPEDPWAYEVHVRGGRGEVSARTWLRSDYRQVLVSGLGPGFDPTGPRRVHLADVNVSFEHAQFRGRLEGAGGVITFERPDRGYATIVCSSLNGHHSNSEVVLRAQFSPAASAAGGHAEGIQLDRLELTVPDLPLSSLGVAGLPAAAGDAAPAAFSGRAVCQRTRAGHEWLLSGALRNAALADLTAPWLSGTGANWRGRAPELQLDELRLLDRYPLRMRFHGVLTGVVPGDVLASVAAEWREIGGEMELQVHEADLSWAGIEKLVVSGACRDVPLDRLADSFGWGRISGLGQLDLNDLTVIGNRLVSGHARFHAVGADREPPWIERRLLSTLLERTLGVALPAFLPERFEYCALGMRLEVRDELLHLFGSHGPRERAILSIAWSGQELPIVVEPQEGIDLSPILSQVRQRFAQEARTRLQALDPELVERIAAATAPAHPAGPSTAPADAEATMIMPPEPGHGQP